jgi:hypothetical protein
MDKQLPIGRLVSLGGLHAHGHITQLLESRLAEPLGADPESNLSDWKPVPNLSAARNHNDENHENHRVLPLNRHEKP